MPGTLKDLAVRMANLREAIPAYASNRAIEQAKSIHSELTARTPVDVASAMSNWQVSLNEVSEEITTPFAASPKGKNISGQWTHTVDPDITRANNIEAAQERFDIVVADKKPGDVIFIANNEPYIQKLDQGSSTQAPAGFTDAALIVGKETFDNSQVKLEN